MTHYNITWNELKQIIRKNKFKKREEYHKFVDNNPQLNMPKWVDSKSSQFKKHWTNWADFLESGLRTNYNRKWRSFKKSREYAHSLNFNSSSKWIKHSKSGNLPIDIPTAPHRVYSKQWKGWTDWLGNTTFKDKKFFSFKKTKQWMRDNNIRSYKQWCKVRKKIKPDFIPGDFYRRFKKEWKGYGDFFGTGYVSDEFRNYVSYNYCRRLAIKKGIKSQRQWQRWAKSGERKPNIPSNPQLFYKGKGWINWNHFLETKTKPRKIDLTYEEAKEFVSKFKLASGRQYKKFVTKNFDLEKNLPTSPESVYSEEWEGWDKFLKFKRYLDYDEAKEIVQRLGIKSKRQYVKLHKKGLLERLPITPNMVYSRRSRNW